MRFLKQQDDTQALGFWEKTVVELEPTILPTLIEPTEQRNLPEKLVQLHATINNGRQISNFAKSQGVTISTILQLVWALVLRRMLDRNDVVFGLLTSARDLPMKGVELTVGPLIDMMARRCTILDSMSISETLNNVLNSFFDSHPHRQASLASVQHALGQTQKLFSTAMSILRAMEWKHEDREDVIVEPVRQYQPTEFDINIHVTLAENTIRVQFDTWRSRISQRISESIFATYLQAVQSIVSASAGGIISGIDIVSTDEKTVIHHIAQRTMQPVMESTLHNLVVQQSRRKPGAEAIHAWDGSFTYQ